MPYEVELDNAFANEYDRLNPPARNGNPEKSSTALDVDNGRTISNDTRRTQSPPKLLAAAFLVLGIGSLLPINALLSVLDYYALLFPELSIAQYITNSYTLSFMLTGTILVTFPPPPRLRSLTITLSFSILCVISVLLPLLSTRDAPYTTYLSSLTSRELSAIVILTTTMGIVNAFDQSVLYGIIGLLPGPTCATGYNVGGAVASILLVTLRIVSRVVFDDAANPSPATLRPGFYFFFSVCMVLCLACVALFVWMTTRSVVFKHHVCDVWARKADTDSPETTSWSGQLQFARTTLVDIRVPALCQLVCFTVTLMFFPGIMSQVPTPFRATISPQWESWYPLIVVAVLAVGDTMGRLLFSAPLAKRYPSAVVTLSLLRVLFLPVFIAQWVGWLSSSWTVVFLLVLLHGYINGFIMNMAVVSAPDHTTEEGREAAGRIMFLMLNFGLFFGSSCGWVLESILTKTTSF